MASPVGPLFPASMPIDGRPNGSSNGSGTALVIPTRYQTLTQQGSTPMPPASSGGMNIRI